MNKEKYVFNDLADRCAGREAKTLKRSEAIQDQDAQTFNTAFQIALRIAFTEARCWEVCDKKDIKANDGKKIKEARETKVKMHYDDAEEAMSKWHSTFTIGPYTRCRHCPSFCLTKNDSKHWTGKPCYKAQVKQLTPVLAGRHALQAGYQEFKLHEDCMHITYSEDEEEEEEAAQEVQVQHEQEEQQVQQLTCSTCGMADEDTSLYHCQVFRVDTCVICERANQCSTCGLEMCTPCYVSHLRSGTQSSS
jgi:hypothetical protein